MICYLICHVKEELILLQGFFKEAVEKPGFLKAINVLAILPDLMLSS